MGARCGAICWAQAGEPVCHFPLCLDPTHFCPDSPGHDPKCVSQDSPLSTPQTLEDTEGGETLCVLTKGVQAFYTQILASGFIPSTEKDVEGPAFFLLGGSLTQMG